MGYSSYREPCHSVHAWGLDDSATVFAGVGEDGVVKNVWLSLHGVPADKIGEWCQALGSLPGSSEMILADWNSSEIVPLKDEQGLASYLRGYHA
jgi:hypothetical protein